MVQPEKTWGSHTQTAALREIHTVREKFRDTYYKMKKVGWNLQPEFYAVQYNPIGN
jgi:hypothetical protein